VISELKVCCLFYSLSRVYDWDPLLKIWLEIILLTDYFFSWYLFIFFLLVILKVVIIIFIWSWLFILSFVLLLLDSGFESFASLLISILALQGWEAGGQYSILHGESWLAEAHWFLTHEPLWWWTPWKSEAKEPEGCWWRWRWRGWRMSCNVQW